MNRHSNIAPAVKLAEQLYRDQGNKSVPSWDQLVHYGATQQLWIERAEKLMQHPPLDIDAIVAGLDRE